jgi:fluoroquinolone transport system permease protein
MKTFVKQLKWQFVLLSKNNIIIISVVVTLIYGLILFFFKDLGNLDKILVSIVLNDPSVIGYFFIALSFYSEMRQDILPAIFVSPVNIHQLLIAKVLSLSVVGTFCATGLVVSIKGFNFDIPAYLAGAAGVCVLSTILGLIMLTFAEEFLKFAFLSVPIFLSFVTIPLLQYLGAINLGVFKYIIPLQGSIDLIDKAVSGTAINIWYSIISAIVLIPLFYLVSYNMFVKKIVRK